MTGSIQMDWAETKKLIEDQRAAWENFKKSNDEHLAELKKGQNDPLLRGIVDKLDARVGELQKQITDAVKVAGRPGASEETEEQTEHRKAFKELLHRGIERLAPELQQKLVQVSTDPDGGYAVPPEFDAQIRRRTEVLSSMRSIAAVRTGTERYEQVWDDGQTGSGWVGEHDERPETDTPHLSMVRPSFGEIYAMPAATQRALEDMVFDVEAWLTDAVSRKFAQEEEKAFWVGDGVDKPKGVLTYPMATTGDDVRAFGTLQRITADAPAGTFTADDLLTLIYATKAPLRTGAQFVMPQLTVARIRRFKDTAGNYLWAPGLTAGAPSQIFGFPIFESEAIPAVGAGANAILFGQFQTGYLIVDVPVSLTLLRDNLTRKGYVYFYMRRRVGGGVMDSQAIKVLTLAA